MATTSSKPEPTSILLYVENPMVSGTFYSALLGRPPVEASANFVMFPLSAGTMLGLWARADVEPAATGSGARGELGFPVADIAAVNAVHADWVGHGVKIVQPPTAMDFGFTFTAVDPDGHRLRVFAPGAA